MKSFMNYAKLTLAGMLLPMISFAEEGAHAAAGGGGGSMIGLAAGLGMGIAVFGAAGAQGKIAAGFMEGVSRNPQAVNLMRTPLILSLIFVETLVLFTLLIALMLVGKV
jgi:F-type H+-transporting ATPase subunit c